MSYTDLGYVKVNVKTAIVPTDLALSQAAESVLTTPLPELPRFEIEENVSFSLHLYRHGF